MSDPRPLIIAILITVAACAKAPLPVVEGGDAGRGKDLVVSYDCIDCHVIPGVPKKPGAIQKISLEEFARRDRISRETIENTPEKLVAYIQRPRELNPLTTMPGLGGKERDARDIAAFLYTLD